MTKDEIRDEAMNRQAREAAAGLLMRTFGRDKAARAFREATGHETFDAALAAGLTREAIASRISEYIELHGPPQPPPPPPPRTRPAPPAGRMDGYVPVQARVAAFRAAYPAGCIETELLHWDGETAVVRCRIMLDDGRILATGHGRATLSTSQTYKGRVVEKAESAAIARALGFAGFGREEDDHD